MRFQVSSDRNLVVGRGESVLLCWPSLCSPHAARARLCNLPLFIVVCGLSRVPGWCALGMSCWTKGWKNASPSWISSVTDPSNSPDHLLTSRLLIPPDWTSASEMIREGLLLRHTRNSASREKDVWMCFHITAHYRREYLWLICPFLKAEKYRLKQIATLTLFVMIAIFVI